MHVIVAAKFHDKDNNLYFHCCQLKRNVFFIYGFVTFENLHIARNSSQLGSLSDNDLGLMISPPPALFDVAFVAAELYSGCVLRDP